MMIYQIDELNGFLRRAVRVGPGIKVVALCSFKAECFPHRSTSNSSVPGDRTLSTDLCSHPAGFPRRLRAPDEGSALQCVRVVTTAGVVPARGGRASAALTQADRKKKRSSSFPSVTLCTFKN